MYFADMLAQYPQRGIPVWFSLRHWEGQGQEGEGLVKGARALQGER